MKKTILILTFFAFAAFTTKAGVITVDNNVNSGAIYTNLQTAVDSSNVGDTILVAGSATSYGTVTIYWPLTLIGAGYHNPYGKSSTITHFYFKRDNVSLGASDSRLMGFYFEGGVFLEGGYSGGTIATQKIDNVVIERCDFDYIIIGSSLTSHSNDTIRNCYIRSSVQLKASAALNNIYIHNNVFNNAIIYGNNVSRSTTFIKNNIFINETSDAFNAGKDLVIENNIFYDAEPQGCTGCSYTKNITYLCEDGVVPNGSNIGSGNINNTDPLFADYPLAGGAFDWAYDFHLQAGSPGENAGTDATDIGIYGGMTPIEFGINPYIPQMVELSIPPEGSSVPVGGTIQVNFKAKKQD